jgi:Asp-tRNA(Asn)/Glu-tRNA(Gln) amidotransferase A subunit family amidase
MSFSELSAIEAVRLIGEGTVTPQELLRDCLARVDAVDAEVQAWAHLDPAYAQTQAEALDQHRRAGHPLGPLHGVPVGIKDIFDTQGLPTENGTVLDAGRKPWNDCYVVSRLRQSGAVIMGKTVSTELAVYGPGKTRNPHNPAHTPGGSSSGSAAAVAAGMVPLAIGSQTNGSVIRPASYCGVVGFKPTFGLISRAGVLKLSYLLDHVGVFARNILDAALLADVLVGFDPADRATRPRPHPGIRSVAETEPPVPPRFAFVKTPAWPKAGTDVREGFAELIDAMGDSVEEIELGQGFDAELEQQALIMNADLAHNLAAYRERGEDQLSERLRGMLADGDQVRAVDYNRAADHIELLNGALDEVFDEFDAIITPAATGEAPAGLDATGDPAFATLWSYLGTPAVTLPLLQGAKGLPIGVQLVSRRGDDARLMRTARWLTAEIENGG